MRGFLASSIGVVCATALALPLAAPQVAEVQAPSDKTVHPASDAASRTPQSVPGSTQSLPLAPLASDRTKSDGSSAQGLTRRTVRPFSLVGVVWDDPQVELHGTVRVRTRHADTGTWSDWQDVDTHNHEHAADPDTPEGASGRVRGSTAPLWVGNSDAVEVRVQSTPAESDEHGRHGDAEPTPLPLPQGLRLELIDPGEDPDVQIPGGLNGAQAAASPAESKDSDEDPDPGTGTPADTPAARPLSAAAAASSAVNAEYAPLGATVIPALTKQQTENAFLDSRGVLQVSAGQGTPARPYVGPRPRIITRKGWGADEKLREKDFAYTKSVRAAFVHHSATGNNYTCGQAPSILRSIYRYHVKSSGWRDFGYNFAIDKCGNIYEGRAGGVAKPVRGAHTLGFNSNSTGVAVLGTYSKTNPPKAAVRAIARLTAWKLGLYGVNPRGKVTMTSAGSNLYKKGKKVRLDAISGHRDGFITDCPGSRLYGRLGSTRKTSAKYQGRG
ncbi:peptidoglycan recognition protein family protein [Streptomyces sp. NPDC002851]